MPDSLEINGITPSEPKQICVSFNNHLVNVDQNLVNNLPVLDNQNSFDNYLTTNKIKNLLPANKFARNF